MFCGFAKTLCTNSKAYAVFIRCKESRGTGASKQRRQQVTGLPCCILRLYRAQRFYVQLLPKPMLLAILIGNGIRLQSTITLCHEKGFFMSYFTRHKGCMSISKKISEHKGCMSILGKSSEHKVTFPNLTRAYGNNGRRPRQKFIFGILQLCT